MSFIVQRRVVFFTNACYDWILLNCLVFFVNGIGLPRYYFKRNNMFASGCKRQSWNFVFRWRQTSDEKITPSVDEDVQTFGSFFEKAEHDCSSFDRVKY